MADPAGAAGDCEGMRTDRHVLVETRSLVGECRMDVRTYCNNLLWKLVDQATEKRRGVFRRSLCDLRINVLRDLFDGKEDWKAQAEDVVGVTEDNFIGGDFKGVGPVSAAVVRGGQVAVGPILLRPRRLRHRYSAERLSFGIRRLSLDERH